MSTRVDPPSRPRVDKGRGRQPDRSINRGARSSPSFRPDQGAWPLSGLTAFPWAAILGEWRLRLSAGRIASVARGARSSQSNLPWLLFGARSSPDDGRYRLGSARLLPLSMSPTAAPPNWVPSACSSNGFDCDEVVGSPGRSVTSRSGSGYGHIPCRPGGVLTPPGRHATGPATGASLPSQPSVPSFPPQPS